MALVQRQHLLDLFHEWNLQLHLSAQSDWCAPRFPIQQGSVISQRDNVSVQHACLKLEDACLNVVIKRIRLSPEDVNLLSNAKDIVNRLGLQTFVETVWTSPSLTEAYLQLLCTELVRLKLTPHFPWTVNWGLCQRNHDDNTLLLCTEKASIGDMKTWCSLNDWNRMTWLSALFQIFSTLWLLQHHFALSHNDLHWQNVLVHRIPAQGYFMYTLGGIDYYVPNLGFLFLLGDFEKAHVPNKIVNYEVPSQGHLEDYRRITNAIVWSANAFWQGQVQNAVADLYQQIDRLHKEQTPLDLLMPLVFSDFAQNVVNNPVATYNLDQPLSLKDEFRFLSLDHGMGAPTWFL